MYFQRLEMFRRKQYGTHKSVVAKVETRKTKEKEGPGHVTVVRKPTGYICYVRLLGL